LKALVLFPHQLYFDFPELVNERTPIYLIEEYLFFKQYPFHKQKLVFHRASMKAYEAHLKSLGFSTYYIEAQQEIADAKNLVSHLKEQGLTELMCFEPDDFLLSKRLHRAAEQVGSSLDLHINQLFINTIEDLELYKNDHKRLFQTDFYIHQRKKRNILLDDLGGPLGGKWSFDADNRKKYPSSKTPPPSPNSTKTAFHIEAESYVEKHFAQNYGELKGFVHYPITPQDANFWLSQFFEQRFHEFGEYEDAIVSGESFLNHSILTPMLNVGILKPMAVIRAAIVFAEENQVELNSLEGFVRQILGWREFVRYVYHFHSVEQRTRNFWGFERKIPKSFYDGTTGIRPVDDAIKKLNKTAYNHHIERLMVLSNFMLLCEFDPDEVYHWFMEMYIDAYDWVMVPNVYGMAQFADGGKLVTKPYISGSNYIFKMSDYKKGEPWADIWDALFWRFMSVNRDFFKSNPRLAMLINTFDKWDEEKKNLYLNRADGFLKSLNEQ
jgi:deoxyribodipyrimidine photolyase-related protein